MRRPASVGAPRGGRTAQVAHIPAPIGGLNTRDPPAMVPITEAISMSNYYPTSTGVTKRRGYSNHITTALSPFYAESLMVYTPNAGTSQQMFAALYTTDIYDVTTAGALGAAVVTGLTNGRFQYINFTNSNGTAYLCAFNGADAPRYWDGAVWTAITGASTPGITGVTTSELISAAVHQRRVWLVQKNSLKAWYLPIDSVGGAAKAIDLGGVASLGGSIMAIASWTLDGGDGIDDVWVCITTRGQLIAYRGTDPSSASTWELVGVWNIAEPVGRRAMYEYKGDVLILTTAGIASAARIFSGDSSSSGMLSDKISATYTALASSGVNRDLWQLLYYPKADMLIWYSWAGGVYTMNTVTGAWSGSFGGSDTVSGNGGPSFVIFNGEPYYAGIDNSNRIRRFWGSETDNGTSISGSVSHGFSEFEQAGTIKQVLQGRLVLSCAGSISVDLSVQFDYSIGVTPSATTISAITGIAQWFPLSGTGVSLAPVYTASSANTDIYNGCYITYQSGGLIGSSALT
jgi:hypothetical protein